MLSIVAGLTVRESFARIVRAYADYQVRRAIARLQHLDECTLDLIALGARR